MRRQWGILTLYQKFEHIIILIALLAIVRKLLILDLSSSDALQLFALVAAVLALGIVHWLVRDQDRRHARASDA